MYGGEVVVVVSFFPCLLGCLVSAAPPQGFKAIYRHVSVYVVKAERRLHSPVMKPKKNQVSMLDSYKKTADTSGGSAEFLLLIAKLKHLWNMCKIICTETHELA